MVGKRRQEETTPTHALLYLNRDTFVGEAGDRLAQEVRVMLCHSFPVVMVHETDPALGGCEFTTFFETVSPPPIEPTPFRQRPTDQRPLPCVGRRPLT